MFKFTKIVSGCFAKYNTSKELHKDLTNLRHKLKKLGFKEYAVKELGEAGYRVVFFRSNRVPAKQLAVVEAVDPEEDVYELELYTVKVEGDEATLGSPLSPRTLNKLLGFTA